MAETAPAVDLGSRFLHATNADGGLRVVIASHRTRGARPPHQQRSELIAHGRLDEAEAACLELHRLYPDQINWLERSALVCQARGQPKMAADYYRKAVAFTYTRRHGFDDDSRAWMLDKIRELDPTALDDER